MQEKPNHIIGVIGVRDFKERVYDNQGYIEKTLLQYLERNVVSPFQFVTGGSRGVESLVVRMAEANRFTIRTIPPNIQQYGAEKAFSLRNASIVSDCTELIIFWDGTAKHPVDALTTAMLVGRRATVYPLV